MKTILSAVCATILAGCAFGVVFAPKEYVDNLMETTFNEVIQSLDESTNYIDSVARSIRTNDLFRSFVKDDGSVYYWITNGIWSTVNKAGDGWEDSYLSGARLYLWWPDGSGSPSTANWTWYLSGGPSSSYRTIQADADATVLRFRYSGSTTNVFIRGSALMYAQNVGEMISTRASNSARIATNAANAVVGVFSNSLATVAMSGAYSDLSGKPDTDAIATNLVKTVISNSLFNLTYDQTLQVMWRKTAENGAFYEKCYTNVNMIGVQP